MKISQLNYLKINLFFDLADQVKMRIPTSCGRVGDCHECIVEVSEGLENLSERSEHETFLTEPTD